MCRLFRLCHDFLSVHLKNALRSELVVDPQLTTQTFCNAPVDLVCDDAEDDADEQRSHWKSPSVLRSNDLLAFQVVAAVGIESERDREGINANSPPVPFLVLAVLFPVVVSA